MKNRLIIGMATVSMMFLGGCGQPAPGDAGGMKSGNVYETDTVSIDESGNGGENGVLNGANSSSDGFQSLYFDFDSFGIGMDMEDVIAKNVSVASQRSGRKIRIEGNCDEFGSDEYNYALGLKRAKAVRDAMRMRGIPTSHMVMVSYGESNPACSDATNTCYAQNRRVDLRLVK